MTKTCIDLQLKHPLFWPDLNETRIFWTGFRKNNRRISTRIIVRAVGTKLLLVDGRTDRLTETRKEREGQTSCNFAKVSIKRKVICQSKIGATGNIYKTPRNCLENIQGKHEIKELQKTALIGTTHIRTVPV